MAADRCPTRQNYKQEGRERNILAQERGFPITERND